MAVKKQSEAVEELKENETVEDVEEAKANESAEQQKRTVTRRLFKDNDRYQADVFVCVNGKAYTIKRGIDVELPVEVAEVLDNADDQMMVAAEKMEELAYQDPK